jgi:HEAT repeat protein
MTLGGAELEELLDLLRRGSDESREAAAEALGRLGPDACQPLAIMLDSDDRDARWWAARALAEVGGEEAGAALRSALGDPDPDVRACAALAMGHLGAGAQARALTRLLSDESTFVASVAADALSMIGEPAVEALAALLSDERAYTRLLAARALGRIGSEQVTGHLFGLLEDPSYLVRHHAQEALETMGVGMIFFSP